MYKKALLVAALTIAVASFALVFSPLDGTERAQANPPGAPSDEKLAFKFNLIAVPNGSASCGQGHRVFTPLSANGSIAGQHMLWTYDPGHAPHIVDCLTEGFDGDVAEAHADLQGVYTVFARILGPNVSTNTLRICRNAGAVDTHLCELGDITLVRTGVDRFSFPSKLFDGALINELWHLEQGTNFRIAEIRLYAP